MGYMRSYSQLAEHIAGGRSKESRRLANNTFAEIRRPYGLRFDGSAKPKREDIAVRLHRTDVLTFHPNGTVTFNTGGWNTVTTKDRINSFAPDGWRVYSEKGILFLYGPEHQWRNGNVGRYGFFDGITVNLRTRKPLHADCKRAASTEKREMGRYREARREASARARAEKREQRIRNGVCTFFEYVRQPFLDAAESIATGLYDAAPVFRANVEACEAVQGMLLPLKDSFEVARVVDAEPPANAITAWHIIGANRKTLYGHLGPVEAGQTWHVPATLLMCAVGLHASPTPDEARTWAGHGAYICKVKVWGAVEGPEGGKLVAAYRKVVWVAELPARYFGDYSRRGEAFNAAVYALEPGEAAPRAMPPTCWE